MIYAVLIIKKAQKELADIPDPDQENIIAFIRSLAVNPRPHGCIKLTNRDSWRVRIGKYRVIYEINDKQLIITVIHVGHRKNVYRLT